MHALRTLLGISIFWVALSFIGDGFTTLVVPVRLSSLVDPAWVATAIGIVTFTGLLAGMLVQPIAGAVSDALYPRWGRRGPLLVGAVAVFIALDVFARSSTALGVLVAFAFLMIAANAAQAVQQAFIPDRVEPRRRGIAAGAKSAADLGGAFAAFLVLGALLEGSIAAVTLVPAVLILVTAGATAILVRETDRLTSVGVPTRRVARSIVAAYAFDPKGNASFVRLVAARFCFLLGTYAIGRFLVLVVADRLGLGPDAAAAPAGIVLAALTLITVATAIPAGWATDRWAPDGSWPRVPSFRRAAPS